jgi:hypothetical protein
LPVFPAHGSSWHLIRTGWHPSKYQFIENTCLTLRRIFKHDYSNAKNTRFSRPQDGFKCRKTRSGRLASLRFALAFKHAENHSG